MTRRNFLSMAAGAVVGANAIKRTVQSADKQDRIKEIESLFIQMAIIYINGTVEERESIIESVDRMACKYRESSETRAFVENYKSILLSLNVIPAAN